MGKGPRLTRRAFGTGTIAALGAGAVRARTPAAGDYAVGDAHVHLFNASDLPVAHFVQYVLIPNRGAEPPGWAHGVIDLFANFFKRRAVTVRSEMGAAAGLVEPEIDPPTFGEEVSAFINQRIAEGADAGAETDAAVLAESYRELNLAVSVDSGGQSADFVDLTIANPGAYATLAGKVEGGSVAPGDVSEQATSSGLQIPFLSSAARMIGWGYEMLRKRETHLRTYLSKHGAPGTRPALVLNHLVDYDYWLDDGPSPASPMLEQVELMARLAEKYRKMVDLRLFAGFCPLKFAIERLGNGPTTLDRLLDLHEQGKVAGFKLYPPMGFRPIGNSELADSDFHPRRPRRISALDTWRAADGQGALGPALDDALRHFYAICAARSIPLMAHSADSNGAGPGYSKRANHKHWQQVVAEFDVRLSLGHLAGLVEPFVQATDKGPPYPADQWALSTATRLLDSAPDAPQVYGDLGYMEEIIDQPDLCRKFFAALKTAYGARDPQLTRIMFGTDWIMLGIERHNRRYLEQVIAGMDAAGYSETQKRNVLGDNLRRFLGA